MSKLKNPPVPFINLSTQFEGLKKEWLTSIEKIGESGAFILGTNVSEFEKEFAAYVGTKNAVAVANGTDALILSLRALNIGDGDEVITTPYTFFASAEAINHVGAKPVFVDIEPSNFNIDPAKVELAITSKTKAIIPVHLFGCPVDMTVLQELAHTHNLSIIEDCAQACGAKLDSKRVGSFGKIATFSFYPTKIIGCYGDGGMITTSDSVLVDRLHKLRNHCAVGPFIHDGIGYNSRLDEIQAALLRIKLTGIETVIAKRQRIAHLYSDHFADCDLVTPSGVAGGTHVFNLYTIRIPNRDRVKKRLMEARIGFSVCYPQPLHLQPVYRHLQYQIGDFPESERASEQCISLPIYPDMLSEQVEIVCEVIKSVL
ncbi:MAG: DegT/DnrJ/EryC1/StrS family aminotransferase [Arenicellales bacterium]|nr:DegT/DnrJ/EryC1/StrS family aminotransferase [Arenicellales bacterium]